MLPPPTPTRIRYHSVPTQLGVGGVTRVTGLTPAEQQRLEQFVERQLGGRRYLPS